MERAYLVRDMKYVNNWVNICAISEYKTIK